MIRGKSHYRRPDPLLLLAVTVVLCALMTSAATAGELFNFFPKPQSSYQKQPQDNGFIVASMGHGGGGLSVSLTPPRDHRQGLLDDSGAAQNRDMLSEVFLLLRYPW